MDGSPGFSMSLDNISFESEYADGEKNVLKKNVISVTVLDGDTVEITRDEMEA